MTNIYNVDMGANFTEGVGLRLPLLSSKTNDELRACITQMQEKIQKMKHDCVTLSLANSKLEKRNSCLKEDLHAACVRRDEALS